MLVRTVLWRLGAVASPATVSLPWASAIGTATALIASAAASTRAERLRARRDLVALHRVWCIGSTPSSGSGCPDYGATAAKVRSESGQAASSSRSAAASS